MSETTIPGLKAQHAIITANCRKVQGGDMAAFDVAVERLRKEYTLCLEGWKVSQQVPKFHLVLTVEKEA